MLSKIKRTCYPNGTWNAEDLIGAKVKIRSMPISNFNTLTNIGGDKTIEKIEFQVSIDGKAFTVITLKELPGQVFLWKDLMITKISGKDVEKKAVPSDYNKPGELVSGQGDKDKTEGDSKFKFGCP